ncbi:MAG: hypothetical protein L3J63_09475 [Geopsychrobacter sp.]|nr:hypothetical protein [Geopsychrobacter sp.]
MKLSRNAKRWHSTFIIVALSLTLCACSTTKATETASVGAEVAYIDLRQELSLVIPVSWQRKHIPVSSPKYHPDVVQWLIPGSNGGENSLSIKTLPETDLSILQQTLLNQGRETGDEIPDTPFKFEHPAGTALRLNLSTDANQSILLAIMGRQHSYLLNFKLTKEDYTQLLPSIEKIILKFVILSH